MEVDIEFGRLLRAHRKALDWTQEYLAGQVHCAVETIRKIESGKLRPSVQLAGALADALGIPPEERPDFIAAARGIRSRPQTSSINSLHRYSNVFIGRESELQLLQEYLQDPDRRLVTLTGIGGVGKTRLAVEVAHLVMDRFADGVYFVPLASVESTQFLVTAIGAVLKLNLFSTVDAKDQLINHLKPKTLLIVLDNFEQLLSDEGENLLVDVLASAPRVKLLVTSRERLNLHSEWLFRLDGLAAPSRNSTSVRHYPAMDLFFQRALQVNPRFSRDQNETTVAEICRQLYGLPLAIEIAASWLNGMSCTQVLEAIVGNQLSVTTSTRDIPSRHRSLYAVFEHSWKRLTDEERRCLSTLAVFRGPFDLEAARVVASLTLPVIRGLVDKSLVRISSDDEYEVHELLRQYLETQLQEQEAAAARDRHLHHYMQLVEQLGPDLENEHHPSTMSRLERSYPNIRTALEWSLTSHERTVLGLSLIGAIYWFWQLGHIAEGRYWHEMLLTRIPSETATVEMARVLHGAAAMSFIEGDLAEVAKRSLRSIEISREINDTNGLGNSLMGYAFTLETVGELEHAMIVYDEVDQILDELQKPHLRIGTLSRRRAIAMSYGRIPEAGRYIDEIQMLDAIGNMWSSGFLQLTRGEEAMFSGRYEEALPHLEQAVSHWQTIADKLTVFLAHRRLAECLTRAGQLERARQSYQDILEEWRELGNKPGMAAVHSDLSYLLQKMNKPDQAVQHMLTSLNLYDEADFHTGFSYALIVAAHLCLDIGGSEKAALLIGSVDRYPTVNHLSFYLPTFVDWKQTTQEVQNQLESERYTDLLQQGKTLKRKDILMLMQRGLQ